MKNIIYFCLIGLFVYSCGTTKNRSMTEQNTSKDRLKIGSDSLDFELIVFEPGFSSWLNTQLPPESFNLAYLENKNRLFVNEYNRRVRTSFYDIGLYPQTINYDSSQEYGMKLNYMLFMYFKFFQEKYNQKL